MKLYKSIKNSVSWNLNRNSQTNPEKKTTTCSPRSLRVEVGRRKCATVNDLLKNFELVEKR